MNDAASKQPNANALQRGRVLALFRRKRAVEDATDEELNASITSGERLGGYGAWLVGLGLVTEAILVFVPLSTWHAKISSFVIDFLIAAGVFAELFFHNRSSDTQKELQQRANQRVAETIERAANAERETEKIKNLTAWRYVTSSQAESVSKLLAPIAPKIKLLLEYQRSDVEAFRYAQQLWTIFTHSGVQNIGFVANEYLAGNVFGLHVTAEKDELDLSLLDEIFRDFPTPHWVLAGSLGLKLTPNQIPPNLHVFVGPKLPPEMFSEIASPAENDISINSTEQPMNSFAKQKL